MKLFTKLIILALWLFTLSNQAFANIKVTLQVNKTDKGYRVIFRDMNEDFALGKDENEQIVIKFKPSYEINDIKDIEALKDLLLNVKLNDTKTTLTFALKSPFIQIVPFNRFQVFGIDILIDKKNIVEDLVPQVSETSVKNANVTIVGQGPSSQIKFEADAITDGAAFIDNNAVYIALAAKPQNLSLPTTYNDFIESITRIEADNATVLKVVLKGNLEGVYPYFRREVNSWKLGFFNNPYQVSEIRVYSKPEASPLPRVEFATIEENAPVINFVDPQTQEKYIIIAKKDDLQAVTQRYNYIDFKVLPTLQGVAIKTISDNLEVDTSEDRSFIQKRTMLNISKKTFLKQRRYEDELETFKMEEFVKDYKAILSLKYYFTDDEKFLISKSLIRRSINKSKSPEDRNKLYANLALFYLANQFYKESLGVTYVLQDEAPEYANSYNISIIKVADLVMIGKFEEAYRTAFDINMADVPVTLRKEIRFWQAITMITTGREDRHLKNFDMMRVFFETQNFISEYTQEIKLKLAFILLDYQLAKANYDLCLKLLRYIDDSGLKSKRQNNDLSYYYGKYYKQNNQFDQSEKFFESCSKDIADVYNRTRCLFEIANLNLEQTKITKSQYADQLETLVMLWHGDELEIEMLKNLGETYDDLNKPLNKLRAYNKIVAFNPYLPVSLELSEVMSKAFMSYYIDNQNQNINHMEALEIFYEFQKYLPLGERGDEVVLAFIDHLIALDLLDRSAAILNHQITHRLKGFKKEIAVNKLATVHNRNRQPYYAVEIIKAAEPINLLPDAIANERKFILAEALYLNFQDDECVAMLDGDYSHKADAIKAEVYWRQQNWDSFLYFAEPRIYELRKNNNMLNAQDSMNVIKVAIAYLISGNYPLLKAIATDFSPRIPMKTPPQELFSTLIDSWKTIYQNEIASKELILKVEKLTKELASKDSLIN